MNFKAIKLFIKAVIKIVEKLIVETVRYLRSFTVVEKDFYIIEEWEL